MAPPAVSRPSGSRAHQARCVLRPRGITSAALGALSAALLAACASAIPEVDPSSPPFAGLAGEDIARLQQGREEYIAKCSGCHPLYPPSALQAERWEEEIANMVERASLKRVEAARILEYLTAASR